MTTKTRKYYLGYNQYGTESSHGFANTCAVSVYRSKKSRDMAIKNSKNITCCALKKSEVTKYLSGTASVKPFSYQFFGIRENVLNEDPDFIGSVDVVTDDDPDVIGRLY